MDTQIIVILVFLLAALLGAAIAWLLLKAKARSVSAAELATLKERLAGRENDSQRLQEALNGEVAEHKVSRAENAELKAELEGERRAAHERKESFQQAAGRIVGKVKALSRDALKDTSIGPTVAHCHARKFQETAKGDLS